MQLDFHYYATYCAAYLAGHSHEESLTIAYSAQFVDNCTLSLIEKVGGPKAAATTQSTMELADANIDLIGLQDITRIWSSFHFLPGDLYAKYPKFRFKRWLNKYRLICNPNGELLSETVKLAFGTSLQARGLAMHILADTWAHRYFAGTPSFVINNATDFYEICTENGEKVEKRVNFNHNPMSPDDFDTQKYTNSVFVSSENNVMNLGHGRAGHLPDYSYVRYKFMPAWGEYEYIYKDNPSDYYHAFCQMVYAMKYLRGVYPEFRTETYEWDAMAEYKDEIMAIIEKKQLIASDDWKAFGEKLSGQKIEDFDVDKYQSEYQTAGKNEKDDTFLGRFFIAALAQKSMVTYKIFKSKNILAGFSVDFNKKGFRGIQDYRKLTDARLKARESAAASPLSEKSDSDKSGTVGEPSKTGKEGEDE